MECVFFLLLFILIVRRCECVVIDNDLSIFLKEIDLDDLPLIINDIEGIMDAFRNVHKVGEVIQSVLNETQFRKEHGEDWVLMDGRELDQNSTLANLTEWTHVPNANHLYFLMKQNNSKNSTGDYIPEGVAQPTSGSFDFTSSSNTHYHKLDTITVGGGDHTHSFSRGNNGGGSAWWFAGGSRTSGDSGQTSGSTDHVHNNADFQGELSEYMDYHLHKINGWDDYTRPKSVVMRSYILIN